MKIKPHKYNRSLEPIDMPILPTVSFSLKDFPDAKKWEVGNKYKIELVVKQTGLNVYKQDEGSVQFEVLEIEGETLEEGEKEEYEAKKVDKKETYSRIKK